MTTKTKSKKRICLRCGADEGQEGGCSGWGKSYGRHLFLKSKKPRSWKGWAVVASFEEGVFLDEDRQFLIYLTERIAQRANLGMDEHIVPVIVSEIKKK